MAKSKKSKILAMALCASVMTGIYAAPVMAANLDVTIDGQLEAVESVAGIGEERHRVEGTFTIAGSEIGAALSGEDLSVKNITASGKVTADQGVYVENYGITVENGGLTVNAGDTTLQTLSAGTTTLDSLTVTDGQAVFPLPEPWTLLQSEVLQKPPEVRNPDWKYSVPLHRSYRSDWKEY